MTPDKEFDSRGGAGNGPHDEPVIRDRRKIDPQTGQVREGSDAEGMSDGAAAAGAGSPSGAAGAGSAGGTGQASGVGDPLVEAELIVARSEAAERTEDLQRLQAEYVNYRKRVDRDRLVARELAIGEVVESLISVLDDIDLARQHGELTGPFAAVSDKLEATLSKFGAERYGTVGEIFDPVIHEALMHSTSADVTETVVGQVLQPGYRVGERILRPARVAAIGPE